MSNPDCPRCPPVHGAVAGGICGAMPAHGMFEEPTGAVVATLLLGWLVKARRPGAADPDEAPG